MSTSTIVVDEAKSAVSSDQGRVLWELLKPRISAMVLVTVALSLFVASSGRPDFVLLLHVLLGTTLMAASSSAWNQWIERERDAQMTRTADRPLPSGRLGAAEVIGFGLATLIGGVVYLSATAGWATTGWAVATWLTYVCVYTPLKPRTKWNTAVGAVSGAMPILIGWSATGAAANWRLAAMLLVLFFWQFPHFIAIAWLYRRQYERAGLLMVTVTDPSGRGAGRWAVRGAALLAAASLLPLLTQLSLTYAGVAIALGLYMLLSARQFQRELSEPSARRLLAASIIYLPLALALIAAQTVL